MKILLSFSIILMLFSNSSLAIEANKKYDITQIVGNIDIDEKTCRIFEIGNIKNMTVGKYRDNNHGFPSCTVSLSRTDFPFKYCVLTGVKLNFTDKISLSVYDGKIQPKFLSVTSHWVYSDNQEDQYEIDFEIMLRPEFLCINNK